MAPGDDRVGHGVAIWLTNTGWSLADQITRILLGGIVIVALSRHLGPSTFGTLAFAVSVVKIFSVVATLGLDRIVVRHAVVQKESAPALLRKVGRIRIASSFVSYALLLLTLRLFAPEDPVVFRLGAVAGLALFFQPFDVLDSFFQSRQQIRYSVAGKTSAFAVCAVLKLLFVFLSLPLLSFATLDALEPILAATGLLLLYRRVADKAGTTTNAPPSTAELLREGAPLLLATVAVIIYMRIDLVMLGSLRDSTAVGIYAAASQLSIVWAFLPMAIAPAAFPILLQARHVDAAAYEHRMRWLLQFIVVCAYAIILALLIAAPWLVRILFGVAYLDAVSVLRIHALSIVFVFVGVVQSAWDLSERLVWLAAWRTVIGAVVNIALNLWLIPAYGAAGAAVATVLSWAVACPLLLACNVKTRPAFRLHVDALFLVTLFRALARHSTGEIRQEFTRLINQSRRRNVPAGSSNDLPG